MLKIEMFSQADTVKGQGVGSVYDELMAMLHRHFQSKLKIDVNHYRKADVSHYHTINFPYYLSTFSKRRGRKVGMVHFLPETLDQSLKMPKWVKAIFYRYVIAFYKRMDQLVVVNPAFIPKLMAYGIPKKKITYIPNFVSRHEFYPVDKDVKRALRIKYRYDVDRFTVIGTGQIQTRKGVMDFVKLAKKYPQYQFIWVGGFSFGKITDGYPQLKQIVDNPPKNVAFPGIVDRSKMAEYYNMADLFLLPSYNELFPMSVMEAFSCGIPVLLRNLDLYKNIFKDSYASFNNFSELSKELEKIVNSQDLQKQLRAKSLKIADYYSEDRLAKIWYRFYQEQAKKS
ncbi:glycosyltransferase family 4 protein [Acetilactobacillus jinshanensis]|uniref:Glycosyltransferase n=1 Tax=Acetilactobacillus jinshanensis TaxID=1720083 RepID=A0A4P6ZKV0_9LACO|nr:glycosyltransferase family 4 protein [Acetilactobacillus jinshanensis]QBP17880.1 glycosyltransferase [Acetilactobacillus jinshanensis]URL60742.1 glycosyltransferase family 4 protein [uncultured bacterium]